MTRFRSYCAAIRPVADRVDLPPARTVATVVVYGLFAAVVVAMGWLAAAGDLSPRQRAVVVALTAGIVAVVSLLVATSRSTTRGGESGA